jgi:hypothetical protein
MVKRWLYLEIRIRYSPSSLAKVVRLALAEGVWSHLPDGFLGIRSFFVFVGMVSDQSLPIYVCMQACVGQICTYVLIDSWLHVHECTSTERRGKRLIRLLVR